MAIILAGHSDRLKLLGISTVCGNQSVEKTTLNALKVLSITGLDHVDVAKGQHAPIMRAAKRYFFLVNIIQNSCPEIHGHSGLDGPNVLFFVVLFTQ